MSRRSVVAAVLGTIAVLASLCHGEELFGSLSDASRMMYHDGIVYVGDGTDLRAINFTTKVSMSQSALSHLDTDDNGVDDDQGADTVQPYQCKVRE